MPRSVRTRDQVPRREVSLKVQMASRPTSSSEDETQAIFALRPRKQRVLGAKSLSLSRVICCVLAIELRTGGEGDVRRRAEKLMRRRAGKRGRWRGIILAQLCTCLALCIVPRYSGNAVRPSNREVNNKPVFLATSIESAKLRCKVDGDARPRETKEALTPSSTHWSPRIIRLFRNKSFRGEFREMYSSARPFPHVVIRDLFNKSFLNIARDELLCNFVAQPKETDLFKVFQVPSDLCGLEKANATFASKIPHVLRLRDALTSKEFMQALRNSTGCGPLDSERVDCSINVYVKGNHLLCHDDHIGSRRLSYILYLVDEDPPWQVSEGGRLELYPTTSTTSSTKEAVKNMTGTKEKKKERCTKHHWPSNYILPEWNSMAVFEVRPGESLHSVEEVHGERPRLSISGWYHAPKSDDRIQANHSRRRHEQRTEATMGKKEMEEYREGEEKEEEFTKSLRMEGEEKEEEFTKSLRIGDSFLSSRRSLTLPQSETDWRPMAGCFGLHPEKHKKHRQQSMRPINGAAPCPSSLLPSSSEIPVVASTTTARADSVAQLLEKDLGNHANDDDDNDNDDHHHKNGNDKEEEEEEEEEEEDKEPPLHEDDNQKEGKKISEKEGEEAILSDEDDYIFVTEREKIVLSPNDRKFLSLFLHQSLLENSTIRRRCVDESNDNAIFVARGNNENTVDDDNKAGNNHNHHHRHHHPKQHQERQRDGKWVELGPPHMRRYLTYLDATDGGESDDHRSSNDKHHFGTKKMLEEVQAQKRAKYQLLSSSLSSSSVVSIASSTPSSSSFSSSSSSIGQDDTIGKELRRIKEDLFMSPQFQRYLMAITGIRTVAARASIRHFRRGKDYCIATGGGLPANCSRIDVTLCFAEGNEAEWDGSNQGGFETYVTARPLRQNLDADVSIKSARSPKAGTASSSAMAAELENTNAKSEEDSEEVAVCRTDHPDPKSLSGGTENGGNDEDGETLLSLHAGFNVLSIVVRDEGTLRFVKYLEKEAPGDRWDISVEYDVDKSDVFSF
eukprot:jgi/Bigna1/67001/fgenesh1_pg.2_\